MVNAFVIFLYLELRFYFMYYVLYHVVPKPYKYNESIIITYNGLQSPHSQNWSVKFAKFALLRIGISMHFFMLIRTLMGFSMCWPFALYSLITFFFSALLICLHSYKSYLLVFYINKSRFFFKKKGKNIIRFLLGSKTYLNLLRLLTIIKRISKNHCWQHCQYLIFIQI